MPYSPSLIRRFWLASALLLPILMGFSALVLHRSYVTSLDAAEKDALFAQIYALIAVAEFDGELMQLPAMMANPRFEMPESGLYARVLSDKQHLVWQSKSLEATQFVLEDSANCPRAGNSADFESHLNRHPHRYLRFGTLWEFDEQEFYFCFEVIHSQLAKRNEIGGYRRTLALWLGGMAFLLLAIQVAIVRWGLRPMRQVADEIKLVEQGRISQLSSRYPEEILPITESLNTLLESEAHQRNRYKNSLSDLAHSLKTPLAVIRSLIDDQGKDKQVDEQIERMSTIISHQLARANAEVKTVFGVETKLQPVVKRLCQALNKVYADKQLQFNVEIDTEIQCQVEEDDLMEVLGNIIENACKYGNSEVVIVATANADDIVVSIEDDGPGIANELSKSILSRGARADTGKIGQGIGLAIAVDILSSYNGALTIERSAAGGAAFLIQIPGAR